MRDIDCLSTQDAQILRLERGPVRGHICKVIVLERGSAGTMPTADDLRDHVDARLDAAPRLRRRLASTPLRLARPVWIDDGDFDVARHVTRVPSDRAMTRAELAEVVAHLMAERLDRDHPLWRIDVIDELEDGARALVWRIHHCLADGTTAVGLGSTLLWNEEPDAAPPRSSWHPAPEPGALDLLVAGAADRARATLRRPPGTGMRQRIGSLLETRSAVRRELRPVASRSPLAARAGPERRVGFFEAPFQECRRAGKAIDASVTVNDVVLSIVAGGLRVWLAHRGGDADRVRVKVPVSLHHGPDEPAVANRDSYFFVDLPVAEADAVERVLAINRQTKESKLHHDAESLYRLGLHRSVARWAMSPRVFTFNVSNVPGPRTDVYVLGARVRELYSIAEIAQHHVLRVAVLSAAGKLSFGLCADREAGDALDALTEGLSRATDELLSA